MKKITIFSIVIILSILFSACSSKEDSAVSEPNERNDSNSVNTSSNSDVNVNMGLSYFSTWKIVSLYQAPKNPILSFDEAYDLELPLIKMSENIFESYTLTSSAPEYSLELYTTSQLIELGFSEENANWDFTHEMVVLKVTDTDSQKQCFIVPFDQDHILYVSHTGYIYVLGEDIPVNP